MTEKAKMSPAERSRLTAKEARARQAEEKRLEKERAEKLTKESAEKSRREEEEYMRLAVPIGRKLYMVLIEGIKAEANKGCEKLETSLRDIVALTNLWQETQQERVYSHAFNQVAKQLRDDGYQVRFGREWSGHTHMGDQQQGIIWSQDAAVVTTVEDYGSQFSRLNEKFFPYIRIEVAWNDGVEEV